MTGMQESRKSLLILEDKAYLRATLQEAFEDRGFQAVGARSIDEAREIFWRSPEAFDVLVLDMHLEEPMTGAEFGIEVKKQYSGWSPEFLIWSAFGDVEYLHLALQLGAAAYLRKKQPDESDVNEVVRHVQALMVRRALRGDRPGLAKEIREIVRHSHSRTEVIDRFCLDILFPELARALRSRFLVLLSDETGTRCFDSISSLRSLRSPSYDELQRIVFGNLATTVPLVVKGEGLPRDFLKDNPSFQDIIANPGSAFVPLIEAEGLQLSLGLVEEKSKDGILTDGILTDNAIDMARTLAGYMQPAFPSTILQITRLWSESDIEKKSLLIKDASRFCLYIGQEVISLFEEALRENLVLREARYAPLWQLRNLGEELREAGELLGPLSMPAEVVGAGLAQSTQELEAKSLLRDIWFELVAIKRVTQGALFHLHAEEDCMLQGRRDYFRSAFSRLLTWLSRRASETPDGMEPRIDVTCCSVEGEVQIRLEDRSRRLSPGLREQLFLPFSEPLVEPIGGPFERGRRLGLYLARVMIEAQSGFFEDRSDDLPADGTGHLFVVRFPCTE